jgi:hypothetical protein
VARHASEHGYRDLADIGGIRRPDGKLLLALMNTPYFAQQFLHLPGI